MKVVGNGRMVKGVALSVRSCRAGSTIARPTACGRDLIFNR